MLKLLVVGGFDSDDKNADDISAFANVLGAEVIRQGHLLLNSCRTEFDRMVAEGAHQRLAEEGEDTKSRLICYVMANQPPVHGFGTVLESRLRDWELGSPRLVKPEPIASADAVILAGGFQGTHRAANWARIAEKPLLPVTRFGGAARDIYYDELDRFSECYESKVDTSDYEKLSDVASDPESFAEAVVALAERLKTSDDVFVIMSFAEDPELEDAYETFKAACQAEQYKCSRVDDESSVPRILPEILNRIRRCAFTIVDVSDERVNVYYELGYAEALGKPFIVTAKQGTKLPFDVKDTPVIFWTNQKRLRDQLARKIRAIAVTQGR